MNASDAKTLTVSDMFAVFIGEASSPADSVCAQAASTSPALTETNNVLIICTSPVLPVVFKTGVACNPICQFTNAPAHATDGKRPGVRVATHLILMDFGQEKTAPESGMVQKRTRLNHLVFENICLF
tara:strand:+ start:701 stop:1081 length:381 start_codon:yes stop_codon:yes gene_type:complete